MLKISTLKETSFRGNSKLNTAFIDAVWFQNDVHTNDKEIFHMIDYIEIVNTL